MYYNNKDQCVFIINTQIQHILKHWMRHLMMFCCFFFNWWKEQNKAHIYTDSKTQIMQHMYKKKNPFSKSEYGQAAALTGPSPLLCHECK